MRICCLNHACELSAHSLIQCLCPGIAKLYNIYSIKWMTVCIAPSNQTRAIGFVTTTTIAFDQRPSFANFVRDRGEGKGDIELIALRIELDNKHRVESAVCKTAPGALCDQDDRYLRCDRFNVRVMSNIYIYFPSNYHGMTKVW